ncbi:zinc-binding alcohol dehydrogenase family protein [Nocardioides bigeumensis]|uniref:Zinc-binding dehydrogenase n=1 Tax=Nocardioides bigeumensis TaxID=433657 RepID=A0ABN2YQX2_9ACTN
MKAAVVTAHGEAPEYAEHPDPLPGNDRVLVRMTAAPVVPLDLLCASGTSYFGPPALPYVPGVQGVGRLDDGTRVWVNSSAGMAPGDGTLAEQYVVSQADVVPVEVALVDTAVAALGLSGVAAWGAVTRAALQDGERMLVLGAGGAVGQVALGVARARGAARVVAVCRPGASADRAAAAGADEVVTLPEGEDDVALAEAMQAALGGPADVVVDPVFGWVAGAACRALAPRGRLVNLGGSAGDGATLSSAVLRGKSLTVLGYTNNSLTPDQRAEALTGVLGLAAAGQVRLAHEVRPLAEVADAWRAVATGVAVRQVLST